MKRNIKLVLSRALVLVPFLLVTSVLGGCAGHYMSLSEQVAAYPQTGRYGSYRTQLGPNESYRFGAQVGNNYCNPSPSYGPYYGTQYHSKFVKVP